MAPMAYRSCLFMHWCPKLAFYGAKSSKLGSVPRIQAVSPGPSSLQLLLEFAVPLSPSPQLQWGIWESWLFLHLTLFK